jgi:hypothetical protein
VTNATALVAAVGNASAFARGRDLAAWLGLTPRQHSTGGRSSVYPSVEIDIYAPSSFTAHGPRSVTLPTSRPQQAHGCEA